ncbi:methyltransferase domain-containing protein [Solemya velum gill symbiont]|uniref:SAM-dependent methyltransferase n=2 Tax=Solemya velum gill symbiont TaxID=2340 RepID=A0A1T2HAN8_SOVGS|nr:methyltransferase domain-containing protein [Solemya velum gill symbiont]OOY33907.1 SAM-dependent methyltransferase [Solemya velum gill symbiont]OOY36561.1 SAM-dependent methyltransferase [Solemya velum gill symbiont]OOY38945.1 SAM-dependent methyltransferase [Solemya velum gill symbiont]OOY45489.1 SAM-dependent methyltransferase [Solemya velum gill symbiont]OOY49687.1 SAM-dependent methyltransferase [Solemya velum gill symbiont]
MKECSKSIQRRLSDSGFLRNYFVGVGMDIGGKPDPLSLYKELFPLMESVKTWDLEDGNAQFLNGVTDCSMDFVHSSHCLEHLVDPHEGLGNWFRVVREGGYLVITVPDEDLYEQGKFPSTFNSDHKWTFTIFKTQSWSDRSVNILDMVRDLGSAAEVVRIEQLSSTYRFDLPRFDQTLTPVSESGIEVIIRKRPQAEIDFGGRVTKFKQQPVREMRLHLNQYKDDMQTMKQSNQGQQPFLNDSDI